MLRRVCVTGGAGFIGSNFVDELLANGVQVRIIDNYRTGRPEFVPEGVEMFEGDVLDTALLLRAFDGCDWIAHFQANADVRHGLERPFFDLEQNGLATARALRCDAPDECTANFLCIHCVRLWQSPDGVHSRRCAVSHPGQPVWCV